MRKGMLALAAVLAVSVCGQAFAQQSPAPKATSKKEVVATTDKKEMKSAKTHKKHHAKKADAPATK